MAQRASEIQEPRGAPVYGLGFRVSFLKPEPAAGKFVGGSKVGLRLSPANLGDGVFAAHDMGLYVINSLN